MITAFPEICRFIGIQTSQIQSCYGDDTEPELPLTQERRMVFILGMDELWDRMEASSLTRTQAWAALENRSEKTEPVSPDSAVSSTPASERNPDPVSEDLNQVLSSLDSLLASLDEQPEAEEVKTEPDRTEGVNLNGSPRTFDEMLARYYLDEYGRISPAPDSSFEESSQDELLSGLDDSDEPDEMVVEPSPEKPADPPPPLKGYNASGDLAIMISDGWKLGLHTVAILDRGTALSRMRRLRLEGNFNHRIGLTMSPDEASCFLSRIRCMRGLAESGDTISAVYEHLGAQEHCFRPYLFQ